MKDLNVSTRIKGSRGEQIAAYGDPLESITWAKIKKIRRAAEGYLYINKIEDVPVRFDVIVVDMMTDPPNINHLVNAM